MTVGVESSNVFATLFVCLGGVFPPFTTSANVVQESNTRNAVVQAAILFIGRSPWVMDQLWMRADSVPFDCCIVRLKQTHDKLDGPRRLGYSLELLSVDALYLRAALRTKKGDTAGVLADYNKIIELTPSALGVEVIYTNRSMLRLQSKDVNGALDDLNKAVSINPRVAEIYNGRAVARLQGRSRRCAGGL